MRKEHLGHIFRKKIQKTSKKNHRGENTLEQAWCKWPGRFTQLHELILQYTATENQKFLIEKSGVCNFKGCVRTLVEPCNHPGKTPLAVKMYKKMQNEMQMGRDKFCSSFSSKIEARKSAQSSGSNAWVSRRKSCWGSVRFVPGIKRQAKF